MSNNAIIAGLLTDIQDYFIYPLIKYPHMVLSFWQNMWEQLVQYH